MTVPRAAGGSDYQVRDGALQVCDNSLYLGEELLGHETLLPGAVAGLEAIAYASALKAVFITETDDEGRLYLPGLPRYLQLPFNRREEIVIDVEGDKVSFSAAAGEALCECSLQNLKSAGPRCIEAPMVEDHLWPVVPGTAIPMAGDHAQAKHVLDALERIKAAAPELHAEILQRVRYIDLLTPLERGKLGEAYLQTARIGLSIEQFSDSLDQVMEVLCHEALGHIKLHQEMGSLTRHFSFAAARARMRLEDLTEDFWMNTRTFYDAEIVHESFSLAQHVESMLRIHNNVLSARQHQRYSAYMHQAEKDLELTSDQIAEQPSFATPQMSEFIEKLAARIGAVGERLLSGVTVLPGSLAADAADGKLQA